ncbi:hypothetical protein D3C76_1220570 [compost metagenome]
MAPNFYKSESHDRFAWKQFDRKQRARFERQPGDSLQSRTRSDSIGHKNGPSDAFESAGRNQTCDAGLVRKRVRSGSSRTQSVDGRALAPARTTGQDARRLAARHQRVRRAFAEQGVAGDIQYVPER